VLFRSLDDLATKTSPTFTGTVSAAAISASGNVTVGGTLGITGTVSAAAISASGNVTVGGTLGITGATTAAGITCTTLTATGNVSFDGGSFVFNDSGADKDFRIEGDTNADLFFSDASTDRIGIGTNTPATRFDLSGSYSSNVTAMAALDIDCSAGNVFTKTIAGNSTFTFSNAPASRAYSFTLDLTHTSGTVTWPAAVSWPRATAPTLTTGKTHLFMFFTDDGGTKWRGSALVDYTT
jgi:hypothetical protein